MTSAIPKCFTSLARLLFPATGRRQAPVSRMPGRPNPARRGRGEAAELVRRAGRARQELSAAMVACGIDPEDWGRLVDPGRFTQENRRRLAEVAQRVMPPLVDQAWTAVP